MDLVEAIRGALSIPSVSHLLFGALGGLAYVASQLTYGNRVRPIEFLTRPFVGALLAWVLTIGFHLPNHATSAITGYAAIDVFDAVASRVLRRFGVRLPFSARNEPRDVEKEIVRRVEILQRARNASPEDLFRRPPQ